MRQNTNMKFYSTLILIIASQAMFSQNAAIWPKTINVDDGKVVIYQPQPESFEGDKLTGRAAVAVTPTGVKDPVFGAIWFDAVVETDRENRIVTITSLAIPNLKFPDNPDEKVLDAIRQIILEDSKTWTLDISLDQLLATLNVEENQKMLANDIKMDPPIVIYTDTPSVLVTFEGEPIYQKLEGTEIKRAVNTPYLMLLNPDDKKYYLSGGDLWFSSADGLNGWENISSPPKNIKKTADDMIGEDSVNVSKQSTIPQIIIATKPTELIQTTGEASYQNIAGTELLYVENTDNQIFMDIKTQKHYLLLAGRWFTSPTLKGSWESLKAENLPEDFKKIPEGSEKDIVLASVPGTKAAEEAIMDAQIPQTAVVDRKTTTTSVEYDGAPDFEDVEGTDMEYAINTSSTVIKSDKIYYVVDDGVWFESKSPEGPWIVSDERPKEVDDIPPSSPVYNVKYVYIYESTPEVVYVGYTPGYTGSYIYGGTVVYGTGYYYQPWYGSYYYPSPMTYGFNMTYNPYAGWSFGFGFSFNYYYPHYHHHHHHGGFYGPPHHYPNHYSHYNNGYYGPNKGGSSNNNGGGSRDYNQPQTKDINRSSNNLYKNHDKGVKTPDKSASNKGTISNNNNNQPTKKGGANTTNKTSNKNLPKNNVYSDKQGNVYKNNGNNQWQTKDPSSNKWVDPNKSSNTKNSYNQNKGSLNQSASDRNRGYQNYNNSTKTPSTNRGGSAGGGGYKGGGGGGNRGGGGGGRR
ncbi:MAG: hypothetical protein IPG60_05730 [Bacteroidetes bacterium]|nr:hypothetical protein [Bacteroidota bacterium]